MQAAVRAIRNRATTPNAVPLKRGRFWLICLFFFLWAIAIGARLFWLQIVRHPEFVERAQKQQQRTFEVAPRRGVLYDRDGHDLAMTVLVDSFYAVPSEIDDKQAAARILSSVTTSILKTIAPLRKRLPSGWRWARTLRGWRGG